MSHREIHSSKARSNERKQWWQRRLRKTYTVEEASRFRRWQRTRTRTRQDYVWSVYSATHMVTSVSCTCYSGYDQSRAARTVDHRLQTARIGLSRVQVITSFLLQNKSRSFDSSRSRCTYLQLKRPASVNLNSFFFPSNRRKLEAKFVSLENVIIKESESTVVGTVKVKNLSFHKEVFIRSTWDSWKSQTDTFCTYSQIVGATGAYVIYDTFSFKLTLPPHSRNLEFCVCYRADTAEHWDSNGVSLRATGFVINVLT